MAQPEKKIIEDFARYFNDCGGQIGSWYVGIAPDPSTGLFDQHKVDKARDRWIMAYAADPDVAKRIKTHFVQQFGADGGMLDPGNGRGIYAFMKSWRTEPGQGDDTARIC